MYIYIYIYIYIKLNTYFVYFIGNASLAKNITNGPKTLRRRRGIEHISYGNSYHNLESWIHAYNKYVSKI